VIVWLSLGTLAAAGFVWLRGKAGARDGFQQQGDGTVDSHASYANQGERQTTTTAGQELRDSIRTTQGGPNTEASAISDVVVSGLERSGWDWQAWLSAMLARKARIVMVEGYARDGGGFGLPWTRHDAFTVPLAVVDFVDAEGRGTLSPSGDTSIALGRLGGFGLSWVEAGNMSRPGSDRGTVGGADQRVAINRTLAGIAGELDKPPSELTLGDFLQLSLNRESVASWGAGHAAVLLPSGEESVPASRGNRNRSVYLAHPLRGPDGLAAVLQARIRAAQEYAAQGAALQAQRSQVAVTTRSPEEVAEMRRQQTVEQADASLAGAVSAAVVDSMPLIPPEVYAPRISLGFALQTSEPEPTPSGWGDFRA
jgi:hypothetical protein